ncbi:MAG: hypothetical protein H7069_10345 [Phormidesmis sp. FL-bin-119]|nr:hypothetical protein [Pedobacter sp.]
MRAKIETIDDLRTEIIRRKAQRLELENDLLQVSERIKTKLRIPVMIYNKAGNFLNSFFGVERDDPAGKENRDWVTNIFRVGLPVFLNKYFFPKSGLLIKSVVAMVSQKAAKNVNKDSITDIIDKLTVWIKSRKSKERKDPLIADYGIPPDSETY